MACIVHLSDIHIDIRAIEKKKIYTHVFESFLSRISKLPPDSTVIVIAGDIFHHKDILSSEDIKVFKSFLFSIRSYPAVIIPGNHDASINNHSFSSIISSILLGPDNKILFDNVYYSEKTEFFTIQLKQGLKSLDFFHLSIYDSRDRKQVEDFFIQNKQRLSTCIFLYHGAVDAVDKYYSMNSRISLEVMKTVRIAILGDYHEFKVVIENKAAYSGSLFRRNLADGPSKKGFILWQLGEKPSLTFIEVPNSFEPKVEDISDLPLKEAKEKLKTLRDTNYLVVNKQQSSALSDYAKLRNIKLIPSIPRKKNFRENFLNQAELIDKILEGYPAETIEKIKRLHLQVFRETEDNASHKFTLHRLEFDNLFRYGKGNFIDFDKLRGLCCIMGRNNIGKSSILRVLLYTLFRKAEEGSSLPDAINVNEKKARVSLTFSVEGEGDVLYKILCSVTRKQQPQAKFYRGEEDISSSSIIQTYKIIKQKVGSHKDFLLTSMQMQDTSFDVIKNKNFLRKTIQHLTHTSEKDMKEIEAKIEKQIHELEEQLLKLKQQKQALDQTLQEASSKLEALRTEVKVKISKKEELDKFLLKKTEELEITQREFETVRSRVSEALNINDITEQLRTLKERERERFQTIKTLCDPIYKLIKDYNGAYEQCNYEELTEVLLKLSKHKDKIPLAIQVARDEALTAILDNREQAEQDLTKISDQINEIRKNLSDETYESLLEKKGRIIEGLEFDPNCQKCKNNKKVLKLDLTRPEIDAKIEQCLLLKRLLKQQRELKENLARISKISREELLTIISLLRYIRYIKDVYEERATLLTSTEVETKEVLKRKLYEQKIRAEETTKSFQSAIEKLSREIEGIKRDINSIVTEVEKIQDQILKLKNVSDNYSSEALQLRNRKQHIEQEKQVLEIYRAKVLKRLPELAIEKTVDELIAEVNNLTLLTSDFRIELDKENRIRLVTDDKSIPLSNASGFQKFVTSLIFRVCLTSMFPKTGDFLIIDEGFGCLDNENCNKVVEFLHYIKDRYRFILVITHVEKMKSLIDNQIDIVLEGKYSKVCY